MDNFEEQEMKKKRPIVRKWFDWLIKQNQKQFQINQKIK